MKDMSKEEWQKETRYLYLLLKEQHAHEIRLQIAIQDEGKTPTYEPTIREIVKASWIVYCIEKNIKPEDYDI